MTFVFEARELPFDSITEAYASRIRDVVTAFDVHHLPLWDRCLLAAVLPIVINRRRAVAATQPPATSAERIAGPQENSEDHTSDEGKLDERVGDGGDVADAAEAHHAASAAASSGAASLSSEVTLADVEVALTMVRQLDELEVVYDSIVSSRRAQQEEQERMEAMLTAGAAGSAAPSPAPASRSANQPKKTSEEIIMEQLLQERFRETAPYLPESDHDDGDNDGGEGEPDAVDVAMCFTTQGESLGIGSAAVFGGHGYHSS